MNFFPKVVYRIQCHNSLLEARDGGEEPLGPGVGVDADVGLGLQPERAEPLAEEVARRVRALVRYPAVVA